MKLIVENLEKDFKGKKVLKNASFEFEKEKISVFFGTN
jgi:ABC-type multidrug transport system ATPase subunit